MIFNSAWQVFLNLQVQYSFLNAYCSNVTYWERISLTFVYSICLAIDFCSREFAKHERDSTGSLIRTLFCAQILPIRVDQKFEELQV